MTTAAVQHQLSGRRLSRRAAELLEHLIDESAPWPSGFVDPFEVGTCAAEFGLYTRAGRRTLVRWLEELVDAGAVEYRPRRGRTPAFVHVLVSGEPPLARDGARLGRDLARDGARLGRDLARDEIARQAPHKEYKKASKAQEVSKGDRAPGDGKDWSDEDLDGLVGPLLRVCQSASPPLLGMDNRPGVLAALSEYSRAQVDQAVRKMTARARAGKAKSPFGMLVTLARAGSPEYFAVPVPGDAGADLDSAGSAPVPTSSFGRPLVDRSDLAERYGD